MHEFVRTWVAPILSLSMVACATGGNFEPDGGPSTGASGGATAGSGGSSGSETASGGASGTSSGPSGTGASSSQGVGSGSASNGAGGGGACSETPCALVAPQCGCAAGEKCSVDGSGTHLCEPAGTAPLGGACGAEDCVAGGLCLGSGSLGYCGEFCDTDTDCPGTVCGVKLGDSLGNSIPGVTLCASACDPATLSGCPSGMSCALGQEEAGQMRFFFMCFAPGAGGAGATCTTASDCAAGFGCYSDGVSSKCYHHCNVANGSCSGGLTCFALNDANSQPLVVDGYQVGVCN